LSHTLLGTLGFDKAVAVISSTVLRAFDSCSSDIHGSECGIKIIICQYIYIFYGTTKIHKILCG
ncbi:MAG: hypothetical protein V2B20_10090, partial [Pseudomonadota bacterium]